MASMKAIESGICSVAKATDQPHFFVYMCVYMCVFYVLYVRICVCVYMWVRVCACVGVRACGVVDVHLKYTKHTGGRTAPAQGP
jgi:hypothetical protein